MCYNISMIKTCQFCGKEFKTYFKRRLFCSEECFYKSREINREYTCINCGKPFLSKQKDAQYCSKKCFYESRKVERIELICKECGKPFYRKASEIKQGSGVCCSTECQYKYKLKYKFLNTKADNSNLYKIWNAMYQRCYNKNQRSYADYGGRGITVCDEWLIFENFYNWALKNNYKDGLSIERIDVNGNYEPNNCEWILPEKQAKNKRNNIIVNYENKEMILKDVATLENISYKRLWYFYNITKDFNIALKKAKGGI